MDPIEPEDIEEKLIHSESDEADMDELEIVDAEAEVNGDMSPESEQDGRSEFPAEHVHSAEDFEDDDDFEFDEMQAQRTQVISTADLSPIEDDDHGHLQAEHAPNNEPPEVSPGRAHECLEIRTPLEEFETYVRARIETLTRLGETEQVELMLNALELGKQKLGGSIVRRP